MHPGSDVSYMNLLNLPFYPLCLSAFCIYYFRTTKKTRRSRIESMVNMSSRGVDGWNNYASTLDKMWSRS
ncbi:hypothetical protein Y032_0200g1706 [Ancylostoma ceylanicum]|nr:hypothetical protein Y032_0200g1706 [Ancylostoma ceylanicum]